MLTNKANAAPAHSGLSLNGTLVTGFNSKDFVIVEGVISLRTIDVTTLQNENNLSATSEQFVLDNGVPKLATFAQIVQEEEKLATSNGTATAKT